MSRMQWFRNVYLSVIIFYTFAAVTSSFASNKAAENLINKGDYAGAYDLLLEENSKHPDDAETLFLLGICSQSGNISSLYLKDYLQKFPDGNYVPRARRLLMDYYSSAGLLITAGALFESAGSQQDLSYSELYNSALYKQQLGEYDDAVRRYRGVFKSDDSELRLWAELGISDCLLLLEDYDSALSGYKNLVEEYPRSPVFPFALVGISEAYRRLGDTDKSKVFYELYREKYEMAPRNIEIEAALLERQSDDRDRQLRSLINVDYYIQVGVFARKSNASNCLKKFRNLKYSTRMIDFREGGRTFYRVLVGPYSSESEARREKGKLEQSQAEKFTIFIQ